MMTLLKVLKNNGGGNAPTPLFCTSLNDCGNRAVWLPLAA
jgi:hypothetical protein